MPSHPCNGQDSKVTEDQLLTNIMKQAQFLNSKHFICIVLFMQAMETLILSTLLRLALIPTVQIGKLRNIAVQLVFIQKIVGEPGLPAFSSLLMLFSLSLLSICTTIS